MNKTQALYSGLDANSLLSGRRQTKEAALVSRVCMFSRIVQFPKAYQGTLFTIYPKFHRKSVSRGPFSTASVFISYNFLTFQ